MTEASSSSQRAHGNKRLIVISLVCTTNDPSEILTFYSYNSHIHTRCKKGDHVEKSFEIYQGIIEFKTLCIFIVIYRRWYGMAQR